MTFRAPALSQRNCGLYTWLVYFRVSRKPKKFAFIYISPQNNLALKSAYKSRNSLSFKKAKTCRSFAALIELKNNGPVFLFKTMYALKLCFSVRTGDKPPVRHAFLSLSYIQHHLRDIENVGVSVTEFKKLDSYMLGSSSSIQDFKLSFLQVEKNLIHGSIQALGEWLVEACTGCTNFLVVIDCPYNVNLENLVVIRFFVDLIISIFKAFPVVGFVRFVRILASLLPDQLCVELRFVPKREVLRRGENGDIRRKTSKNREKLNLLFKQHCMWRQRRDSNLGRIGGSCSHTISLPIPGIEFSEGNTYKLGLSTNLSNCLFDGLLTC